MVVNGVLSESVEYADDGKTVVLRPIGRLRAPQGFPIQPPLVCYYRLEIEPDDFGQTFDFELALGLPNDEWRPIANQSMRFLEERTGEFEIQELRFESPSGLTFHKGGLYAMILSCNERPLHVIRFYVSED